jgi:hypothetical protein
MLVALAGAPAGSGCVCVAPTADTAQGADSGLGDDSGAPGPRTFGGVISLGTTWTWDDDPGRWQHSGFELLAWLNASPRADWRGLLLACDDGLVPADVYSYSTSDPGEDRVEDAARSLTVYVDGGPVDLHVWEAGERQWHGGQVSTENQSYFVEGALVSLEPGGPAVRVPNMDEPPPEVQPAFAAARESGTLDWTWTPTEDPSDCMEVSTYLVREGWDYYFEKRIVADDGRAAVPVPYWADEAPVGLYLVRTSAASAPLEGSGDILLAVFNRASWSVAY